MTSSFGSRGLGAPLGGSVPAGLLPGASVGSTTDGAGVGGIGVAVGMGASVAGGDGVGGLGGGRGGFAGVGVRWGVGDFAATGRVSRNRSVPGAGGDSGAGCVAGAGR